MWVDIDVEVVSETARAVLLNFESGMSGRPHHVWVPKSCYRVIEEGNFKRQQIKAWFIYKNRLNFRL